MNLCYLEIKKCFRFDLKIFFENILSGAGDGLVTVRIVKSLMLQNRNVAVNVFCTEASIIMQERLREKKFR